VEVVEDVGDYVKRHSCEIGCGVAAGIGAAGCLGAYCIPADYVNCILCSGGVAVAATRCETDTCG
jgi:hypothetical protein